MCAAAEMRWALSAATPCRLSACRLGHVMRVPVAELRHGVLSECQEQVAVMAICDLPRMNASLHTLPQALHAGRGMHGWVPDIKVCGRACTGSAAEIRDLPQAGSCRMRHPDGIQELLHQMRMHFHVPPAGDPSDHSAAQAQLFARFIYLSQVQYGNTGIRNMLPLPHCPRARSRRMPSSIGRASSPITLPAYNAIINQEVPQVLTSEHPPV